MKTCVVILLFLSSFVYGSVGDYLVCIHGFFGSQKSMQRVAKYFKKEGWEVNNWEYPSRDKWIEEHAVDLVAELQTMQQKQPGKNFDFITHSMGGLILRAAMNHPNCPESVKHGKVVLLAPPNGGACWARFLKNIPFSKQIAKRKAGKELLNERLFDYLGDFPSTLQVLVIAGNGGINPFFMGENDGTIAVRETYLNTPHEHLIVNASHEDIVEKKKVIKMMASFLR